MNKNMKNGNGAKMNNFEHAMLSALKPVVKKKRNRKGDVTMMYDKKSTRKQWKSMLNSIDVKIPEISAMIKVLGFIELSLKERLNRNSKVAHMYDKQNEGHKIAVEVLKDRIIFLQKYINFTPKELLF